MRLQIYVKPNVIGLHFDSPKSRDLFWTKLGENRKCAAMFGKESIRFDASKADKLFRVPVEVDELQIISDQAQLPAKPKTVETPVPVTALKAPEPIAAIGSLPPEVTGEAIPLPEPVAEVKLPPPTPVAIPEVRSVLDPEPSDKRTKAWKDWKARQK